MRKWGLDYETLARDEPSLVMLSTSIAGQDGPWRTLAGYGNVGSSLSGFQNLVGWEDGLPLGPFGPYTDYVGPRLALVALLAALEHRRRTGEGSYIDIAQVEAGVFFLSPQVAHHHVDGTVAERRGNRDEVMCPHGVFPCADDGRDRFVAVAVRDDADWRALTEVIERPDLAGQGRPGRGGGPARGRGRAGGRRGCLDRGPERRGRGAGPAGRGRAGAPGCVERGLRRRRSSCGTAATSSSCPTPSTATTTVEGPRYVLSETPGGPRRAAPTLGQDNETVLRDLLGYDAQRIAALEEEGVLR